MISDNQHPYHSHHHNQLSNYFNDTDSRWAEVRLSLSAIGKSPFDGNQHLARIV